METKPLDHSKEFIEFCDEIKKQIQEISTNDVEQMIEDQRTFHLIDVRDRDEFEKGHIPNAHFLSKGWIEAKIHELVKNKEDTIVLYCGGGNRSVLATYNLLQMGYTNVLSMEGGIKKWVKENKPIKEL